MVRSTASRHSTATVRGVRAVLLVAGVERPFDQGERESRTVADVVFQLPNNYLPDLQKS
jgi:hypothetical protein